MQQLQILYVTRGMKRIVLYLFLFLPGLLSAQELDTTTVYVESLTNSNGQIKTEFSFRQLDEYSMEVTVSKKNADDSSVLQEGFKSENITNRFNVLKFAKVNRLYSTGSYNVHYVEIISPFLTPKRQRIVMVQFDGSKTVYNDLSAYQYEYVTECGCMQEHIYQW